MKKVVIEVLELKSCPECYKLIKVLEEVLSEIEDMKDEIEVVFLDLFDHNSRINELGMYQCPALAINGDIRFIGEIPHKKELKSLIISEILSY